jgi:TM2 domain-containing membrane protein YozV
MVTKQSRDFTFWKLNASEIGGRRQMKMAITFMLNIIIPGLGNIILGYWFQGLIQVILTIVGFVLILSVFIAAIGVFLLGLSWIYALAVWFIHLRNKDQ